MPWMFAAVDLWSRLLRSWLARLRRKFLDVAKALNKPTCLEHGPTNQMEWHERVDMMLKGVGPRKPILEGRCADDFHQKTGRWSKIERVIDRPRDRYRERVIDAKTGQVLRSCDEPLSSHRDRGSAKKQKLPNQEF